MEEFKIGDLVLVREIGNYTWVPYQYVTTRNGKVWFSDGTWIAESEIDMVPLSSENEYLIGTDITPTKPWEPKHGELVAVRDEEDDYWKSLIFIEMTIDGRYRCGWTEDSSTDETVPFDRCEPIYKHFNVPSKPNDE